MKIYRHIEKLGQGGNGIVWKVANDKNEMFAKKVLKNIKETKAYSRFKDEVKILSAINHAGIIKVIDSHLPEKYHSKNEACYIMPLGMPLKDYLKDVGLDKTFKIILDLIDTVEFLHDNDITHRDLKIENILIIDGKSKISDFGLANFPKQQRVSRPNEKIGPAFTIAPEMKRISSTAEYKKADIYSLAKTIWVILTKQWLSFDGQYNTYSKVSLKHYISLNINKPRLIGETYYFSVVILEKLLSQATHNDPEERPLIKEFKETFNLWIKSNSDYQLRNNIEWNDAIKKIFPVSIPVTGEWSDINDIKNILSIIFSEYDSLNHSFFPKSGGMDFESVRVFNHNGKSYLLINESYLISPSSLIFESMYNSEWSYFRLELGLNEPIFGTKVYDDEELVYLNYNDELRDEGSISCRSISYLFKGSFLIVQKISRINNLSGELDHYSGLHNKGSNEEYKKLITRIIEMVNRSSSDRN